MFKWLKCFCRDLIKIEVTVHVPTITVLTYGPQKHNTQNNITESGPGSQLTETGSFTRITPALTDDERIDELSKKLENSSIPEVQFGKEHKT